MLFDENIIKGVLFEERFSTLLTAGKLEVPSVTVEEIEDRSKADGFSKMIAHGQTLWFVTQCIARSAQHRVLTLVELVVSDPFFALAVLNGVLVAKFVFISSKPDETNRLMLDDMGVFLLIFR